VNPDRSTPHAFTVDLEEWFHGIELAEDAWPSDSRLRVGLDRLLLLLDRHDVRATFFVLGAVAERHPRVVAELAAAGHEIGCHGHSHRFVYRQSPAEFRDDLRRARDVVADAAGRPPTGYRAPYFSIRKDSLWAFEVLAEEGFVYDSSVFPVHNYRYGIPDAPREPHDVETPSGSLRELPLTPARLFNQNLPFSGGAYLRILPWWVQKLAWATADRSQRRVIAYVHPWELDPHHPVIDLPRRVALTHYARLGLTERRLARLLSAYRFGRLDEAFSLA
jgi:polysaccharide deacetylase family protein (PEP-CTERM system associated)